MSDSVHRGGSFAGRRAGRIALLAGLPLLCALVLLGWRCDGARDGPISAAARTTLGVHALVGQEEDRHDPRIATPSLATARSGSSLAVFVAGYASNDAPPQDSHGNHWRMQGAPVVYRGYDARFDVRAYLALNARGGRGHRIWQDKRGRADGEATLVAIEARNGGRLVDAAQVYPAPGWRVSSGSVSTDGPALLVALWFGDGSGLRQAVSAGNGFRVVERFTMLPPNSAVQAVAAVREVDHAGTYQAHWYAAPRQGAVLWLLAFAPEDAAAKGPSPGGKGVGARGDGAGDRFDKAVSSAPHPAPRVTSD